MDSIISGATWYVDTLNQRLRLDTMRLPALTRVSDRASVGWFSLGIPGEIDELTAEFQLRGSHADVRSLFGREPGDWTNFYYYERLRDIVNGVNKGRVVILKGLVSEVEQPETTGKKANGPTRYKVGSIVEYRDMMDGKAIHWFDIFRNKLVINGVDYTAEANQIVPVTGMPA